MSDKRERFETFRIGQVAMKTTSDHGMGPVREPDWVDYQSLLRNMHEVACAIAEHARQNKANQREYSSYLLEQLETHLNEWRIEGQRQLAGHLAAELAVESADLHLMGMLAIIGELWMNGHRSVPRIHKPNEPEGAVN